ncbi:MAG TPA: hypothetical protein VHB47_14735 [Thermoanaerobaculia bacterium]|jgi:hypothetical protein|nr:hypothetical protein [Thermoanaerobaculia bacterium]
MAVETTRDPGDESSTRADLRAAAADLRYTGGYLFNVIRRSAEWCSLDESHERLAYFAGKISRQVAALVKASGNVLVLHAAPRGAVRRTLADAGANWTMQTTPLYAAPLHRQELFSHPCAS